MVCSMMTPDEIESIKRELIGMTRKQRRQYLYALASSLGHGGKGFVVKAFGISYTTLERAAQELRDGRAYVSGEVDGRAGRPKTNGVYDSIRSISLQSSPGSIFEWTAKSLRTIAAEIHDKGGRKLSVSVIRNALYEKGFRHWDNEKMYAHIENRAAVFKRIEDTSQLFLEKGMPVLSLDFDPEAYDEAVPLAEVNDGDIPNGGRIYPCKNRIAAFFMENSLRENAVMNSLRAWWDFVGERLYPDADAIYIICERYYYTPSTLDMQLAVFSAYSGCRIYVTYYPAGYAKWSVKYSIYTHIQRQSGVYSSLPTLVLAMAGNPADFLNIGVEGLKIPDPLDINNELQYKRLDYLEAPKYSYIISYCEDDGFDTSSYGHPQIFTIKSYEGHLEEVKPWSE